MSGDLKIEIDQNYVLTSQHNEVNRSNAIYVGITGPRVPNPDENVKVVGSISPDRARQLADELIAIADQFDRDAEENAKPKLPTEQGLYINAKADPTIAPIFRYSEFSGWTMKTETFAPHEFKTVEDWVSHINRYAGLKRLVVEP